MEPVLLRGELELAEVWPLGVLPEPSVWPLSVWGELREHQPF